LLCVHGEADCGFERCDDENNEPCGGFQPGKQCECEGGHDKVGDGVDGRGPERVDEGGQKYAEYGCVDALKGGSKGAVCAQAEPEREYGYDGEQAWGGESDKRDDSVENCACDVGRGGLSLCCSAEIGGEGEERAGQSLGGAVSGEEDLRRDPAWADDRVGEHGEEGVASAEDETAGAVEGGEKGEGRRRLVGCRQERGDF